MNRYVVLWGAGAVALFIGMGWAYEVGAYRPALLVMASVLIMAWCAEENSRTGGR